MGIGAFNRNRALAAEEAAEEAMREAMRRKAKRMREAASMREAAASDGPQVAEPPHHPGASRRGKR